MFQQQYIGQLCYVQTKIRINFESFGENPKMHVSIYNSYSFAKLIISKECVRPILFFISEHHIVSSVITKALHCNTMLFSFSTSDWLIELVSLNIKNFIDLYHSFHSENHCIRVLTIHSTSINPIKKTLLKYWHKSRES